MNCKRLLFIVFIAHCTLWIANSAFAQNKYGNNWITGCSNTFYVDFSNSTFSNYYDTMGLFCFTNSNSCISDSMGNFILACNMGTVFNNQKQVLNNGDTLIDYKLYHSSIGNPTLSQGSLILPINNRYYYIFTISAPDSTWINGNQMEILYMHKVDMQANAGMGKVIEKRKVLMDGTKISRTGLTACRHANGKDWWLAKQGGADTNINYTFFIGQDTVAGPFAKGFNAPKYTNFDRSGQMMFSNAGTKMANVSETPNQVFLADFDRCKGQFTNPKIYNIPALIVDSAFAPTQLETLPRGLCFSPNDQYLYVIMRSKIFQLDLFETDSALAWYLVASLDTTFSQFQQYNMAQLGLDNKLYIGYWAGLSNAWSVVDNPNVKGSSCNFCNRCLRFPKNGVESVPNVTNYNLGASPTLCYPLDTGNIKIDSMQLYVSYQNLSNQLTIAIAKNIEKKLDVFSSQGALIYSQTINVGAVKVKVDASSWAKGVYIVRVGGQSRKVIIN